MDPLTALAAAAVTLGTPLLLAGLGELVAERSGVLNLGVEGVMLVGAVTGFAVAVATREPWLAASAALTVGAVLGAVHAALTVGLGVEQVTAGLALALFGTGLSAFLGKPLIGMPNPVPFRALAVPGLAALPVAGPVLFRQDALVYLAYGLAVGAWWWLERTRAGLRLRACGEHPDAAEAMGVNVAAVRAGAVVAGGALAGLAGAYLSLAYTPAWTEHMTGGLGWIAIALVIFGTWRPLRLAAGAVLFGAVDALGFRAQVLGVETSAILLRMLPYLFTLGVLVLITVLRRQGGAGVPAALARPYRREA